MRRIFVVVLGVSLTVGLGIAKGNVGNANSLSGNPPVVLPEIPKGEDLDDSNIVLLPGTINDAADNVEKKFKEVVGENTLIGVVLNQDPNRAKLQSDSSAKVYRIFYGDTPDPAFAFVDRDTNRAYVPIRFIAERLGADVTWKGDTQTIIFTKAGLDVQLVVGQKQLTVNQMTKTIDAPAFVRGNRTYVPVRVISEAFGAQVFWKPRSTDFVTGLDVVLVNYQ